MPNGDPMIFLFLYIVTKSNDKLNIFIFFNKSFTNKFLIGIVKIKKDKYEKVDFSWVIVKWVVC